MSKARNLSDFISDPAIDATEIGSNAITTDKVADLAVTHAKLHTDMDLSGKTVTLPTDGISGNSIHGGVISSFASTGIDDNASSTAVTITSDGDVGIGTATPSSKLEVLGGDSTYSAQVINNRGDAAGHGLLVQTRWNTSDNYVARFTTNSGTQEVFALKGNGNVGIGTTSPDEKLHIHSASDTTIKITDETVGSETYGSFIKGFSVGGSGGRLHLGVIDNNTENLAIEIQEQANGIHLSTKNGSNGTTARRLTILGTSGNVGIGTASPSEKLHVEGSIRASDITLETQTLATLNSSAAAGTIAYVSDEGGQLFYKNAVAWKSFTAPLGTASNPAASAEAIISAGDSIGDGAYYIETSSGVVHTYCMMSWGGYMLAMKIDNNFDNNFRYDGSYWTTTSPVNESSMSSSGSADAVSRLYYDFDITDRMRVSLNTFNNYLDETSGGNIVGKTLKECMTYTFNTLGSDRSRADFLNWIAAAGTPASNWDNQPNCNSRGFNVSVSDGNNRWGINMNNENNCSSNDASIGLGSHTNNFYGGRTTNAGGSRWSPDQAFHYNAWVWVK